MWYWEEMGERSEPKAVWGEEAAPFPPQTTLSSLHSPIFFYNPILKKTGYNPWAYTTS